jgi:AcrR family transcriptional regulator
MPKQTDTSPRKSPRQQRSKVTVDAMLTAGARILAQEGLEAATTARIAEVAGVSIGTLYQYFPSKEAIVAALIDRYFADVEEQFTATLAGLSSAPTDLAVKELVRMLVRMVRTNAPLYGVLEVQSKALGKYSDERRTRDVIGAQVVAFLKSRRKGLRPKSLDAAIFLSVHVVDALVEATLIERPEFLATQEFEDELCDLVGRYLLADQSERAQPARSNPQPAKSVSELKPPRPAASRWRRLPAKTKALIPSSPRKR